MPNHWLRLRLQHRFHALQEQLDLLLRLLVLQTPQQSEPKNNPLQELICLELEEKARAQSCRGRTVEERVEEEVEFEHGVERLREWLASQWVWEVMILHRGGDACLGAFFAG